MTQLKLDSSNKVNRLSRFGIIALSENAIQVKQLHKEGLSRYFLQAFMILQTGMACDAALSGP